MLLKTKNKVVKPDWKFSWKLLPSSILSLEIFPRISKFGSNFLPLPTAMSYKTPTRHFTCHIWYCLLDPIPIYWWELEWYLLDPWILVKQKIEIFHQKLNIKKESGHSQTEWNHDVSNAVHEDDISIFLFHWNSNYLVIIF